MTRAGPCQSLRKPRDLVTDAPCRTARPHRLASDCSGAPRALPMTTCRVATVQTRSAFHRRVPAAPLRADARTESFVAATDTSVLPPRLSFRHAFHALVGALRPPSATGLRRSSRATCRSSTSAIVWTRKHNPGLTRPRRTNAVLPPRGGWRRLRRAAASWAVTVQGSRSRLRAPATPASTSCADTDLPQTDRPRHLLSLTDAARVLENVHERRLAGYQPLRRLLSKPLEDWLARRAAYPNGPRRAFEGRPLLPLAKATSADCTQGAFHPWDLFLRPMGISARRPRSTTKLPPPPTPR